MTAALELLNALRVKDVSLWVDNDQISYDAPAGALTEGDLAALRSHKPEILKLLAARDPGAAPIERADRSAPLPLSLAQQRLWFIDRLEGAAAAYNLQGAFRLAGDLDVAALLAALEAIVRRHEALRTALPSSDGVAVQSIAERLEWTLGTADISVLPVAQRHAAVQAHAASEAHARFNLSRTPLWRALLVRVGPAEHVLLVTMHHIIADGWSLGILAQELAAHYASHRRGGPAPFAPLAVQYPDYAQWQRRCLAGGALQEQRDYWRRQLSGTPALLDLPTDHPRPAVQSYAGASVPLTLSPELAAELKSLGRSHGATLFMTLLAGWSILLSRLSREEDVVVGVPMANRPRTELEPLIGLFVNTLALRTRLDAAASVTEVLRRVREATLAAHANQDLPFAEVIEALRPERSLSHSPLFQTLFALQNAPQQDIVIADGGREGGLVLRPTGEYIAGGIDTARFDLTLSLEESGGTLTGALNYASDLFDRATIDRWIDHFKTLLTAMVQTPSSSVSALPLLAARERQVVVEQFNDTFADYGGPALVHRLFEAQAAATPLAPAVELAGRHLSYAELNGRANQLARHLLTRGIGPDRVVGVCIERSFEMVVALLGILKAGGAYVPLDPAYPRERLAFMLADAGMPVLLTQQHLAGELPVGEAEVFALDARWPELAGYDGSDLAGATQTSRSLAYVIYTSGSTGKPKGAMNEHRAVANRLQWMQHSYRLGPADAVLQKTPLSFDVSVWEVFWPLLTGARLVLARPGGHHDPHYLGQVIREARVTTLHFVPSMLQAFVDAPASAACTKVRHIVSSGEELSVALQEQCLAVLPQAALHNLYGPTEAAVDVSSWDCQSGSSLVRVPIGRPIANTRLYLLDGARQPVPVGVPGEIYIGGIAVGRGYWNRPELTAERFVADPFSGDPEARLYKTGDLGRWRSDGAIEYLGRNDHQVKVRGFRIELGEIEAVLRRAPAVHEVAVIVREDGAAAQQLVAYFTCRDEEPSPEALRTFAAQELPTYMVPSAFVKLGVLPLQPNGKLDRSALPRPDFAQAMESRYVAPRNAVEEALCAIWAAVLGLPKLGIDDNFFGVGGDSILSLRAVEKARAAGLPTTVEDLFRDPTVARLAQVVLERHTTVAASVPVEPFALLLPEERAAFVDDPGIEDAYPLSALQAGMYFHSELHRDSGVYHDIFSLSIGGSFAVALFEQALSALVARHPMLRSSFHTSVADRLVQAVHRAVPLPLAVHDISHLDQAVQEQFVERWMEEEKWRRFPWTQPPLFRVVVHRRAPERFQFTLSFHHAILDGWSLASLQTELFEHYLALHSGRELTIAAPQSLYRDYIALEEQALQSAEAREFWTRLLADAVRLKLPEPEKARARQKGIQVATCDSELDEGLCGRLKARSRELKVPLKTLLFAAHLKVMALASGHSDVLTGLVSNGRLEEADGDRALGLYLNSLPFRLQLEDGSWRGLVSAVHRLEQAALPYRRYPMQAVQQLLGGEPLINTLFNYVHFHVYQRLFEVGMVKVPNSRTFEQTNFDLMVVFSRALAGEGLSLSLAYDPAALDEEQAARLSVYYHRALAAIAQDVDARHGRATLLTDDELALQRQWNDTVAVWDGPRLVHELIETQAAKTPSGVAVVCDDRSISYEELNRRANQLARYLRAHGASFDRVVAICVDRTIEMVIGILGVLKSGAAYLPVDPQYPRERLAYMLENAAPPIMLTDGSLCDKLPRTSATLVMLDADWPEIARHDAANVEDATASPADLAYVIYTSGSTGQPKGTAMPHRVLVNLIEWQRRSWPVQHAQRTLQFAALGFDVAFQEMFSTLAVGGTLVLIPDAARSDPAALIAALRKNEVQRFFVPFSALQAMAEVATRTGAMPLALEDLITAGERLRITPEIARFFGSHRGCRLHNHYGPTECHAATAKTLTGDPDTWDEFPTIGRPIANARIYLLDTKRRPVPVGTPG
ncbi:MAG TPA: amino acid adenylation domain-containing protein, partial [Burkholderiales bacterium]|nr:amino acid adenylation domain-containing protein [Burkholderiales bacterium]